MNTSGPVSYGSLAANSAINSSFEDLLVIDEAKEHQAGPAHDSDSIDMKRDAPPSLPISPSISPFNSFKLKASPPDFTSSVPDEIGPPSIPSPPKMQELRPQAPQEIESSLLLAPACPPKADSMQESAQDRSQIGEGEDMGIHSAQDEDEQSGQHQSGAPPSPPKRKRLPAGKAAGKAASVRERQQKSR